MYQVKATFSNSVEEPIVFSHPNFPTAKESYSSFCVIRRRQQADGANRETIGYVTSVQLIDADGHVIYDCHDEE